MEFRYEDNVKSIKALSDGSRLKIIDILSCGEMCSCDILNHFEFTQPTLSHHLKVLMDCGFLNCRKEGLWNYYSLNSVNCNKLILFLMNIVNNTDECVCEDKSKCECE